MKQQITRELAWAAATDAGNKAMREGGRTAWSASDRERAEVLFWNLMGLDRALAA